MKNTGLVLLAVASPVVLVLCLVIAVPVMLGSDASACGPGGAGVVADVDGVPKGSGKWKGPQLKNAAVIVNAGKKLGLSTKGQTIGVMTAMGESSLTVIDKGDSAGPDSRGLFQQRANGAWGSYKDRMNPTTSATNFFKAMTRVKGWEKLEPSIAAHRVQRNRDPFHYEQFFPQAVKVVAAVSGAKITDVEATASDAACADTGAGAWTGAAECGFTDARNPRPCREAVTWAAGIAGGPDRCSNKVKGDSWDNYCDNFVAQAYGYKSSGSFTAQAHWDRLKAKGSVHVGDTKPPVGALVFWQGPSSAGHVALYAGKGKAFSNDYIAQGCIDLTPMDKISGSAKYLGWAEPDFPGAGR